MESLLNTDEYRIADDEKPEEAVPDKDYYDDIMESYGESPEDFVRTESFVSGMSSHSRVATPDPGEDKCLKIGSPPPEPGVKVAAPPVLPGKKCAKPSALSMQGDFRRTIQVSGETNEDRHKIGMKLYGSSIDPTQEPISRRRRR